MRDMKTTFNVDELTLNKGDRVLVKDGRFGFALESFRCRQSSGTLLLKRFLRRVSCGNVSSFLMFV